MLQLTGSDGQAISSIQTAIQSPRTPSFPLIECEFPPILSLNKLGDGSIRSSIDVDNANIEFCTKLVRSLAPIEPWGHKVWLLTSSAATSNFNQKVKSQLKNNFGPTIGIHSLKDGLPMFKSRDRCVLVSPCVSNDYAFAKQLAMNGISIVLVNGLSKVS